MRAGMLLVVCSPIVYCLTAYVHNSGQQLTSKGTILSPFLGVGNFLSIIAFLVGIGLLLAGAVSSRARE